MDPERLDAWEREHASVLRALSDPDVVSDRARLEEVSRREKDLDALISVARRLREAQEDLDTARQMLSEASADDRELVHAELESRADRRDEARGAASLAARAP